MSREDDETDRIRVLVVSHARQPWGAERVLLCVAPLLRERGFDLALASPAGALGDEWRETIGEHIALQLPDHRGLRAADGSSRPRASEVARELAVSLRWAMTLRKLARRFDIVHSNNLWGHVETVLASRLARRPVVVQVHDLVRPGLGRRLLGIAARGSSATVAISGAVADCIRGAPVDKVRVIANGVDLERFSPGPGDGVLRDQLANEPGAPLIAILGRIDPEKGVDLAIRAVEQAGPPVQLVVVGAPSPGHAAYVEAVRRECERRLGKRGQILAPTSDVPSVLRNVDVLVNASLAEPFGLTVLEAQAVGVPVVATNAGGVTDLVRDRETGLLVEPGDVGAIARAIDELTTDRRLASELVGRALQQARACFGIDRQADELAALYRSLAPPTESGRLEHG